MVKWRFVTGIDASLSPKADDSDLIVRREDGHRARSYIIARSST